MNDTTNLHKIFAQRHIAWSSTEDYDNWSKYMQSQLKHRTCDDFYLNLIIDTVPQDWCDKLAQDLK
jgi:hypothetical protein